MLSTQTDQLSWQNIIDTKKEAKVRFGQIILKLVFLFAILIAYSLLRKFNVFNAVRIKGVNPSDACLTDSSHMMFANMNLALHEYTVVRRGLQIFSSLMIDAVFIYHSINW